MLVRDGELLTFGKYKGLEVGAVPTDYLAWTARTIRPLPPAILNELRRREAAGGRNGVAAGIALQEYACEMSRLQHEKRHSGGRRKKPLSRRERQRRADLLRKESLKQGVWIVGEHYEESRARWLAEGGNPSECPFDVRESTASDGLTTRLPDALGNAPPACLSADPALDLMASAPQQPARRLSLVLFFAC